MFVFVDIKTSFVPNVCVCNSPKKCRVEEGGGERGREMKSKGGREKARDGKGYGEEREGDGEERNREGEGRVSKRGGENNREESGKERASKLERVHLYKLYSLTKPVCISGYIFYISLSILCWICNGRSVERKDV